MRLVKQEEGKFLDIIDLKNKLNSLENKLERLANPETQITHENEEIKITTKQIEQLVKITDIDTLKAKLKELTNPLEQNKSILSDNEKQNLINEIAKTKKQITNIEKITKKWVDDIFENHQETINLAKNNTWSQIRKTFPSYKEGLKTTLILAIDGLFLGFLLVILCTLMKNAQSNNPYILKISKGINWIFDILFFILKTMPTAAQAMLVYYGIGKLCNKGVITSLNAGLLVLILNSLANINVILMQNIKFLDKGQIEAALSLGMSQRQVFSLLFFPKL
nr:ABC transporter permease subunit ['Chrysanthemum coronarium' phytoplasma]